MEIIEQIGSYAGLAAVLGLAVLSALYFSQARDVKRLREWAGRAPEREPTPVPEQRVVAKPVPKPPLSQKPAAPGAPAKPPVPKPATGAAAAAAGAAPAVATGPAAATPAAARAAEATGTEVPAETPDSTNGTDEGAELSQDTVLHPPPAAPGEDQEEDATEAPSDGYEAPADDEEATAGEREEDGEDVQDELDEGEGEDEDEDGGEGGPEEDEEDEDSEDEGRPEDFHEDYDPDDTGDEDEAVSPPVPPRRPTVPIGAAATQAGQDRRSTTSILPPYEKSRPGGVATAAGGGGGLLSSPRRAVAIVGGTLLAVVVIAIGVLALTGDDEGGGSGDTASQPAGENGPAAGSEKPSGERPKKKAAPIDPGKVSVAVLNGTTVPGLAANLGDSVERQGFRLGTVTNFIDQQRAESVVKYAPGAEREAAEVGRRLKISQREPIDAESQGIAGDATVVVVAGADKTQ